MPAEASTPRTNSDRDSTRVFRSGLPEDAEAIRAILHESNLSIPAPGEHERITHSQIGQILRSVCEEGGVIIGVLQWRYLGEELEILDLAIAKDHRRRGYGAFMLENLLRKAAASGVRQIFLEVRESNAPAVALYKIFGFAQSGRRPNYYRDPVEAALVMQLKLTG